MPGNRRSWAAATKRAAAAREAAEREIVDAEIVEDEDAPGTAVELHASARSAGLAPRVVGDTIYLQLLRPVVGYGQAGDTLTVVESVQTEAMVAEGLAVVVSSPTGPVVAQAPTSIKWQPFTRYPAGWVVINPSGQLVTANGDFVSAAAYSSVDWTLLNDIGGVGSVDTTARSAAATAQTGADASAKKASNGSDFADAGSTRANLRVPILSSCQAVSWEQTTLSGAQSFDGYSAVAGDRVLLTAQTNPVENGPWIVAAGAWTRPTDYPTGAAIKGRSVHINAGTRFGGTVWVMATSTSITVDTDATTWAASYQKSDDRNLRPRVYSKKQPVDRVTSFAAGHGFTASGTYTSFVDNTTDFLFGSQCVEMVVPAGSTGRIGQNGLPARNTTGKHAVVWIKTSDLSAIQEIDLFVGSSALASNWKLATWTNSATLKPTVNNRWTPLRLTWQLFTLTGTPDRTAVTDYRIHIITVAGSSVDVKVGAIDWVNEAATFPNGAIVFTFDDGLLTQYTAGRRILDKYGWPGTLGVVVARLADGDTNPTTVNMTTAMALDLQNNHHWELAGHAYDEWVHVNRDTGVTLPQLEADLRALKQWLVDNGSTSDSYIYPGGYFADASNNDDGVVAMVGKYFAQARTIRIAPQYNIPGCIDPLYLTTYDPGGGTLSTAEGLVDQVFDNGLILVFENHNIGGSSGIPEATFESLCDYIYAKGVEVLTLQDVFNRLQTPSTIDPATLMSQAAGDTRYRQLTTLPVTLVPKVKSADQTLTNDASGATRINDTDLDMTGLVASGIYKIKLTLYYNASTAADLSIKWGGTVNAGGSVLPWCTRGLGATATAAGSALDMTTRALSSPATLGGIGVGSSVCAVVEGTLFVGTIGGDLQVTWGAATANDGTVVTVQKGSMLEMTRIA